MYMQMYMFLCVYTHAQSHGNAMGLAQGMGLIARYDGYRPLVLFGPHTLHR